MADTTRTVQAKFDGDTSGLRRAARDGEQIVKDFGGKAGRDAGNEFEKEFNRSGKRGFFRAANEGAMEFARTLTSGLRNLQGPAVAALVAALVLAMPAVGALAAGGLVLAFGAGLVGLALAVTAQSPRVKQAFDRMIRPIGDQIRQIAKPFEQVWVEIMAGAATTFATFKPELEKAFAALAPVTAIFAGQFFTAMEQLAPVIDPIVQAFSAIAASLGPALPGIVAGIADGIVKVAESVEENPDALTDFFGGLGEIIAASLTLIAELNRMNTAIEDLTGGISGVDIVMTLVLAPIATLIGLVRAATAVIDAMKAAWDKIKGIFEKKHTADIEADDSGFRRVLKSVSLAAAAWDGASFISTLSTTASPFYAVLRAAYGSGGAWRSSTFKSALGATTLGVQLALDAANALGNSWAGKVFRASFVAVSPAGALLDRITGGRAEGGAVMPGRSYRVGERGPEILTMGSSPGHITPNHELGGDTHVYVTIDGEQLQGRIDRTIRTDKRQTRRSVGAGALRGAPA